MIESILKEIVTYITPLHVVVFSAIVVLILCFLFVILGKWLLAEEYKGGRDE